MLNEGNKKVFLMIIGAAVTVFILVYLAITIIGPGGELGGDLVGTWWGITG